MKILIGVLLGLIIGSTCRWFNIPLPSPPQLIGVLLIASMTTGYILTDKWFHSKESSATHHIERQQ